MAFAIVCTLAGAATVGVTACANIWGFDDLVGAADGGYIPITEGAGGAGSPGIGGDSGGLGGSGDGGSSGSGGIGSGGSRGSVVDGGGPGAGGSTASGGAPGSGGTSGAGGAGTGGRTGTGGNAAAGSGAGGSTGSGGQRGTGGVTGAGGVTTTGGAPGSGGATGAGGTTGTGGRTGVGGAGGVTGCLPVTSQLLMNPGFDSGTANWTISVAGGFPLIYVATGAGDNSPDVRAQSPQNLAWFGGYNNADDVAAQSASIPAAATAINFSFFYAVISQATGNTETDVMDVTVTAGTQTTTVAHFSNLTAAGTLRNFSAALSTTLAGQTVRIQFRDQTNGNAITSFYIDTVALQVVTCP
jgi:hypothetical protein